MRYLRARRQEGFISVIAWFSLMGIALGVATLIIVMSVMNGFRHELLGRILGLNGHITVMGPGNRMLNYDSEVVKLKGLEGVVKVTPLIERQVMATANKIASGAVVRGIKKEDLMNRKIFADNIRRGSLEDFRGEDVVMIGTRMASKMRLSIGDKLKLISPNGQATAFGTIPRVKSYRVAALFEVGMFEYDSTFIFMPMPAAQMFFKLPDAVSSLEVFIDDPDKAPQMAMKMLSVIPRGGGLHDWQKVNASYFNALQVERNVMFLILTLIILVAAFNIISSMIMLVKDKGRDIAILRTMGATRGSVMRIFLLSGASVGLIGTSAGLGLGLAFTTNIESIRQWLQGLTGTDLFSAEIYFLSKLPAVVDPGEVAAIVTMGLALSFLATVYPSWRAARLDPAEALRYE